MTLNPPRRVRAALYIFTAIGSFVMASLAILNVVGADAQAIWGLFTTLVATLAGLNTVTK